MQDGSHHGNIDKKAYDIASDSGILFVYLGNVPHDNYENTICPKCKNICINRYGYSIDLKGLKNDKCLNCGTDISIVK